MLPSSRSSFLLRNPISLNLIWKTYKYEAFRCLSTQIKSAASCAEPNGDGTYAQKLFAKSKRGSFYQRPPSLKNQFEDDALLQSYIKRVFPDEVSSVILPDLINFGQRTSSDIYALGNEAERNPPTLEHFDAWGVRIDEIKTCNAWKQLHNISAEEGLISLAYERKHAQWSRLYQAIKLYLFSPSSGLYSCPLAMTDGAATIIENIPDRTSTLNNAYSHLTTRDSDLFWTSGQWMTERQGGSDVANGTETLAVLRSDGAYDLHGYKWFTSATDANMAVTLARIVNADGKVREGSGGLSLFYLETRNSDGQLNGIEMQRLKNKLGTRQLPTAELLLDGCRAELISEVGKGVRSISPMLTITRIHNSLSSVAAMRRIVNLARDYASKRKAFGKSIDKYPLHMQTLANLEVETRASFLFVMEVCRLLGLKENNMANDKDELLLRLLTPIIKLYSAKQAVAVVSEGLECFGGQGYIEDTGLPVLLRDSQVLPIWEGTTNVLSVDVLRAIAKTNGEVMRAYFADVLEKLVGHAVPEDMVRPHQSLLSACKELQQHFSKHVSNEEQLAMSARDLSYSIARVYMGSLLYDHARSPSGNQGDVQALIRWCSQDLIPVVTNHKLGLFSNETIQRNASLLET